MAVVTLIGLETRNMAELCFSELIKKPQPMISDKLGNLNPNDAQACGIIMLCQK